jgi:hypothetical protein
MGRFETQWLAGPENLSALADLSGQWIDLVHGRRPPHGIVLDMDSSVSLACVQELERRGLTVLFGVMHAPQDRLPDWKVAIISVTPKLTDPGASKRRYAMVDRRVFALPCLWPDEKGPS